MKTAGIISLFIGLGAAATCYVEIQQQFDGGIGGSASSVMGSIKRGDCPKTVDEPNTDNCNELKDFTPVFKKLSVIDAGLAHVDGDSLKDGYMDYGEIHHDFNDDNDACQYSDNNGFSASINMQVCSFPC